MNADEQPLSPGNQALPDHQELIGVNPSNPGDMLVSADISVVSAQVKHKLDQGEGMGLAVQPEVKLRGAESGLGLDSHQSVLTWQKSWLDFAPELWPNITMICRKANVSKALYYRALKECPDFAAAVHEVDQGVTDAIEGLTANLAMNPKQIIDRMAYLRAHRPELYDRAKRIIVEGHTMSADEISRRSAVLGQAVDAQIVNAYTTRKERAQAKREGSSLLPSGESEGGASEKA